MPCSLSKALLTILALLQFVAPLVHAHAGQSLSDRGLHIPGLESYSAADPAQSVQASTRMADADGFIFMVDTGIKQDRKQTPSDNTFAVVLPQLLYVLTAARQPPTGTQFPPYISPLNPNLILTALSPRAPPA